MRHHHLLAAHVVEAVGGHRIQDPVDGLFQVVRAAEAVPERVAHIGQALEARTVGEGRVDDLVGVVAIGLDQRDRRVLLRPPVVGGEAAYEDQQNRAVLQHGTFDALMRAAF